jgi:septal ring factor EnvC (AmiA/AmiB activator)
MNSSARSFRISILVCLVLGPQAGIADEIEERRRQLDDIRQELDAKRTRFDSLEHRQRGEEAKLQDIEQQAALSSQLLLRLSKESKRLGANIEIQRLKLEIMSLTYDGREATLKRRLRQIYMVGNLPGWVELISAKNSISALVALRNMKILVDYDKKLLQSYRESSEELKAELRKYQNSVADLSKLQSQQQVELARREKTLKIRKSLVVKLRKDRKEVERSISKLQDDAREISGILETLELERARALVDTTLTGLAGMKGNLIWPAQGKIIRPFGSIKDKRGIVLSNPGIDIQAQTGSDVLSAATGLIAYVSWLRGYGQFIIVDHGLGFYTLYANLADILVESGEKVSAGEIIGFVGDSGSLEGPKLHFEVRHKQEQLNPLEWLR